MTSEGLGKMFVSDFGDTCAETFHSYQCGDEGHRQTCTDGKQDPHLCEQKFNYSFTQVTIKAKTNGSPNTIFNYQCPGNSSHYQKLLLYKGGQVNRQIAEFCSDPFVWVAWVL